MLHFRFLQKCVQEVFEGENCNPQLLAQVSKRLMVFWDEILRGGSTGRGQFPPPAPRKNQEKNWKHNIHLYRKRQKTNVRQGKKGERNADGNENN